MFFWRAMNCWGWGTWIDRWQHFQKDPAYLVKTWDILKIKSFNLDNGCNFWRQVRLNYRGKIDTWAIFWYATIFDRNVLCLNPSKSLVRNIGHDGSGENCGKNDFFCLGCFSDGLKRFPIGLEESKLAVQRIRTFYSKVRFPFFRKLFGPIQSASLKLLGR